MKEDGNVTGRDWWLSEMVLKRMVTGNGLPEG